jgi:hypothetical protein
LADLEADGDAAIDARLRQIDAAVGIDGFDEPEIERVDVAGVRWREAER